jgi:hypothetical protein
VLSRCARFTPHRRESGVIRINKIKMEPNQIVKIKHKSGKIIHGYVGSFYEIPNVIGVFAEPCNWYMFHKDGFRTCSDGTKVFLGKPLRYGFIRKNGGGAYIASFFLGTGNQVGPAGTRSFTIVE